VVGGGIGGAEVLRYASDALEVTLIEPKDQIEVQALYPEYLVGKSSLEDFTAPLRPFCERTGARLVNDRAVGLEDSRVVCSRGEVEYDLLVIATGAVQNYFGVKGAELAFSANTLEDVTRAREFLVRRKPRIIAIIGSGLTGVETACELAASLECTVFLVERMDRLLPMFPPQASKKVERAVLSRGVQPLTGKRVQEVEEDRVLFDDRSSLECEMVIWTAGIKAPPFVDSLSLPKHKCWLLADPYLRSKGSEDIFVIGDNAWVEVKGEVATKTGIEAERQAKHAAKNLNRMARGKSPLPYSILASMDNQVAMISTGCGCAICVYGNSCLPVPAKPMYLLKRWIDKAIANRYK